MNRLTTLAATVLLGSVALVAPQAEAALILAPNTGSDALPVKANRAKATVFWSSAMPSKISLDEINDSSSTPVFGGAAAVNSSLIEAKLAGGDLMPAGVAIVPLPAAAWLFGTAFLALCWLGRRSGSRGVGMLPR